MNTIVTLHAGQPVSTTLAISQGTELDHASIIKLVRTYQSDLEEFGGVGFEIQPFITAGGVQNREIATLNEQQSTLLLTYMRNSEIVRTFKKALVKAFYELKQASSVDTAQLSRMQLIQLAMQAEQERIALEHQVEVLQPKAVALDRIATFADGSMCMRDAAKILQIQEKKFIQFLAKEGWIYRRPMGSGWLAYADKLHSGWMEHKVSTGEKQDGSEWVSSQVRITAKGLAKLSEILSAGGIAA